MREAEYLSDLTRTRLPMAGKFLLANSRTYAIRASYQGQKPGCFVTADSRLENPSFDRYVQSHTRAMARLTGNLRAAAVKHHDALDDRQPQAGTT